ncbi:MAG: hypothetical protein AB1714_08925 [Acidobacteriota bacterium]
MPDVNVVPGNSAVHSLITAFVGFLSDVTPRDRQVRRATQGSPGARRSASASAGCQTHNGCSAAERLLSYFPGDCRHSEME